MESNIPFEEYCTIYFAFRFCIEDLQIGFDVDHFSHGDDKRINTYNLTQYQNHPRFYELYDEHQLCFHISHNCTIDCPLYFFSNII